MLSFQAMALWRAIGWPIVACIDLGYYLRNCFRKADFYPAGHRKRFIVLAVATLVAFAVGYLISGVTIPLLTMDAVAFFAMAAVLFFGESLLLIRLDSMEYFEFTRRSHWFSLPAAFGTPLFLAMVMEGLKSFDPSLANLIINLIGLLIALGFCYGALIRKYQPKDYSKVIRKGGAL